jgi:anti-anti-sigma factor
MQLTVTVTERTPGTFTFLPEGSIDSNTSGLLENRLDAILEGFARTLIFDMEKVNYISSAGIRVVFKAQKAMKQRDGQFLMTNLQPQVKKVFEIINALPTLNVFSSIKELDRYLDLMQKKVTDEAE